MYYKYERSLIHLLFLQQNKINEREIEAHETDGLWGEQAINNYLHHIFLYHQVTLLEGALRLLEES